MPVEYVVRTRRSRQEVEQLLSLIPSIVAGQAAQRSAGLTLLVRVGLAVLGRVRAAFVVKARGGTDDSGLSWPPLAKSTVAYSRRHPGVLWPGSRRAPYAPSWMLSAAQRNLWWQVYRQGGGRSPQGAAYHARGASRTPSAAIRAWFILKEEGATTIMDEYGDTPVEILRDTGILLNSITPGVSVGVPPPPVPPPTPPDQVFRFTPGEVVVGTSRAHAGTHHRGVLGYIPQRRLWPEPDRWPANWWTDILEQGRLGLVDIATFLLS